MIGTSDVFSSTMTLSMPSAVSADSRCSTVSTDTAFQLCFRLEEPPEDSPEARWVVRYLLQARDDSTAVINQSSIYVFATSMMNIGNALASFGNARIGIDPEKLPVYLNDIDAEILAGEKPLLAF